MLSDSEDESDEDDELMLAMEMEHKDKRVKTPDEKSAGQRSLNKATIIKCIYCWSRKTLTDM